MNVDEGWLAGFQNCPPQGNPGGGVGEIFDLEAVARRWLVKPSVLTKEQHEGIGVNTDSKFLIGRVDRIVVRPEVWGTYISITCNPLF